METRTHIRRVSVRGEADLKKYKVGEAITHGYWSGIVRRCKTCHKRFVQWMVGANSRDSREEVECEQCYVEGRERTRPGKRRDRRFR